MELDRVVELARSVRRELGKVIIGQDALLDEVVVALLAGGQETGHISLWLTEEFPERTEYENLLGLAYGFMVPIPRGWWWGSAPASTPRRSMTPRPGGWSRPRKAAMSVFRS